MTDDRDVLTHAILDLIARAIEEGATPYDIVSTLAAVINNVLGNLKPELREETVAFLVSTLRLGISFEDFVAAKETKGRMQ
jgi:hypothetical protein